MRVAGKNLTDFPGICSVCCSCLILDGFPALLVSPGGAGRAIKAKILKVAFSAPCERCLGDERITCRPMGSCHVMS